MEPAGRHMGLEQTAPSLVASAVEAIAASTVVRYGGMGGGMLTGIYAWATSAQGLGMIGIFIAACGYGTNLYYQRKRDMREAYITEQQEMRARELHIAEMRAYSEGKQ